MATVAGGSTIGVLLGPRLPDRVRTTVLTGIGLIVVAVGLQEFLATRNAVFPLVSIVAGGVIGELIGIEEALGRLGEVLRRRLRRRAAPAGSTVPDTAFVNGFVTASITFCVGPLTVLGSLQDGIGGGAQLLVVKAALDGLVAIVYASTLGIGVAASVVTVGVVQGLLTLLGLVAGHNVLSSRMVAELTATGGVMIAGLGVRLLNLREVRVASYLPGLVVAPLAVALFAR